MTILVAFTWFFRFLVIYVAGLLSYFSLDESNTEPKVRAKESRGMFFRVLSPIRVDLLIIA